MAPITIPASLSAGEKAWRGMADSLALNANMPIDPEADPYAPGSPDYALRTREQVMELPGGIVRIDYGATV